MKTKLIISGALIFLTGLTACKKDSKQPSNISGGDATVTFTVNGGGFTNKLITINGNKEVSDNELVYFPNWDFSKIVISDRSSERENAENEIDIFIEGKSTGSQDFGTKFSNGTGPQEDVNVILTLTKNSQRSTYASDYAFGHSEGKISVTKFSDVGDAVEGDFKGALHSQETDDIITISSGHFILPRHPDVAEH